MVRCAPFCSKVGAALWHDPWGTHCVCPSAVKRVWHCDMTLEDCRSQFVINLTVIEPLKNPHLTKFRRLPNFKTGASGPQTNHCPQTVSLTSLHLLVTLINILKEIALQIDIDNNDGSHYYINDRTFY